MYDVALLRTHSLLANDSICLKAGGGGGVGHRGGRCDGATAAAMGSPCFDDATEQHDVVCVVFCEGNGREYTSMQAKIS